MGNGHRPRECTLGAQRNFWQGPGMRAPHSALGSLHPRSIFRASAFAILMAVSSAVVLAQGCAQQREGQRCDLRAENNGNADCQPPLICYRASELNASEVDLCCPPDRRASTVAACTLSGGPAGLEAGPPPSSFEGGTVPDDEAGTDGGAGGGDGAADSSLDQ
jgi:hypothetical protein